MSQRPSRMLQVLDQAHALRILLPHLPAPDTHPDWLTALDASAAAHDPLPVRFAILMAGMTIPAESRIELGPKMVTSVTEQAKALRASNECTDAAARLAGEIPGPIPQAARQWFLSPERQDAEALLALFNRHDAWRRPERLRLLMTVAQRLALPDHPAQTVAPRQAIPPTPGSDSTQLFRREKGDSPSSPLPVDRLSRTVSHNSVSNIIQGIEQALGTAAAVDTGAIARQHQANPTAIRSAIDDARREAISGYLVSRS